MGDLNMDAIENRKRAELDVAAQENGLRDASEAQLKKLTDEIMRTLGVAPSKVSHWGAAKVAGFDFWLCLDFAGWGSDHLVALVSVPVKKSGNIERDDMLRRYRPSISRWADMAEVERHISEGRFMVGIVTEE